MSRFQGLEINTENRDRTIKQFNYGTLNVDVPGDYWKDTLEYWDTTEEAAKASNCGVCVAFDISERMKDCPLVIHLTKMENLVIVGCTSP